LGDVPSALFTVDGRNLLPHVKIETDERLGTVLVSGKQKIVVPQGTRLIVQHVTE
jgi:hypothetical protein